MNISHALSATAAAAAFLMASLDAHAASMLAIGNATVQPVGPRTGSNGLAFLNIEGSANGSFASYGAVRFDAAAIKSQFDSQFGVGGWQVNSISLQLTQSNAAFTSDGDISVYFSNNDSAALAAPSTLTYASFANSFADAALVTAYTFHQVSSGTVDSYTLFSRTGSNATGGVGLAADLLGGGLTTLLLRDQSANVAATYAGFSNTTYAGPTLVIDAVAAVPEPGTYALLAFGLACVGLLVKRSGRG